MNRPLQVGITGGIGAGKSLISRIFKCFSIPVYDADTEAKKLMTSDSQLIREVIDEFGPKSYDANGNLNRAYLGSITFSNPVRLAKLNSIVHPRVAEDYEKWLSNQHGIKYIIREAALMYEAGAYARVDKMIVVSAPENLRITRVLQRDPQRSTADIKAIMKNQWSDEEKTSRADYIILNDDEVMVIPQVLFLHNILSS